VSEGDYVDDFKHIFIRPVDTIEDHELPVNAETWFYFSVRIRRALTEILEASDKPPLIVAHGGVFLGIAALLGIENFRAKNCEPYLFKAPSEGWDRWNIVNLKGED